MRLSGLLAVTVALAAVPTGPEAGQKVPDFRLRDQSDVYRTLGSIMGPKGAMIVFYRSADW